MKKTFLLIAAILMMGSAAFAGGGFDIAIGPKVGYQTAQLRYDRASIESGFSNHFTAGVFGRVTFGKIYVQPEVLYLKTSNLFNVDFTGQNDDNPLSIPTGANVNLTLNQMNLQVPVLVGIKIIDLDIIALRAQAGPTANFVLKSETLIDYTFSVTGDDGVETEQTGTSNNGDFDTKSISWGLQAGVGVDILDFITLDINYNFGLSSIFRNLNNTTLGEYFDFGNTNNTTQNLFMVTVGLKFL